MTCEGCRWHHIIEGPYYSERHICAINEGVLVVRSETVSAYDPPRYPPACSKKEVSSSN